MGSSPETAVCRRRRWWQQRAAVALAMGTPIRDESGGGKGIGFCRDGSFTEIADPIDSMRIRGALARSEEEERGNGYFAVWVVRQWGSSAAPTAT
ncbi:hypothetical protein ACLOJK_020185 [Asimina triloba]